MGASHHAAGDLDAARAAWEQGRDLLDDHDQAAADQIRAQLHHLGESAADALR
jgi:hypothetical protein